MNNVTLYDCFQLFWGNKKKYQMKDLKFAKGKVRFYYNDNNNEDYVGDTHLLIHYIEIDEKYRRTGIFSAFLNQLLQNESIDRIGILGVSTSDMYSFFNKKFPQFKDIGGDFIFCK